MSLEEEETAQRDKHRDTDRRRPCGAGGDQEGSSGWSMAPPPGFQVSDLQNWKNTFLVFEANVCGSWFTTAPGTNDAMSSVGSSEWTGPMCLGQASAGGDMALGDACPCHSPTAGSWARAHPLCSSISTFV